MASSRPLDALGRTAVARAIVLSLGLSAAIAWGATLASAQTAPSALVAHIRALYEQQRWTDIIGTLRTAPARESNADLFYYYGSAQAQLGHWDDARSAFLAGRRLSPRDSRFPIELGGVAFREKNQPEAAKWLRSGLRLDPDNAYANNFLATLYFLNGNLEAALKYWNRVERPQIEVVRTKGIRVRPELLDRTLAFAPASALALPALRTTRARLEGLGIFGNHDIVLAARDDGKFDVDVEASERIGTNSGTLRGIASTFRGILWSTAYLDFYNIRESATNLNALARWDPQKRRLLATVSAPLREDPKYRVRFAADLRNENWVVRAPSDATVVLDMFGMDREALEASITSFKTGRWIWSTGAEISHRAYRKTTANQFLDQQGLLEGPELKQFAQVDYGLILKPERRFSATLSFTSELGTIWSGSAHTFTKFQGGLLTRWFPKMKGRDYASTLHLRYGRSLGDVPFDEMYMVGLERDTDLLMRGHSGTFDGRKGKAPIGRNYALMNVEMDKLILDTSFFDVALSPFVDLGKVTDPLADLGSRGWLVDSGMQVKFRVWGFDFTMTYGRDFRAGQHAFYVTTGR